MSRKLSSTKRCGCCVKKDREAFTAWQWTCIQFEKAGRDYFQSDLFCRAVAAVEKYSLLRNRVPLRADYRDRMLAALARAKYALFEYQPFISETDNIDFEALTALIVIWSEGPEATAKRSSSFVCDARSGTASFIASIRNLQCEERAVVRLTSEYKRRDRQSKTTLEAA